MTKQQIKEEFDNLPSLREPEIHSEVDMDYYEAWYKPKEVGFTKRQTVVAVVVGVMSIAAFVTNLIILFR